MLSPVIVQNRSAIGKDLWVYCHHQLPDKPWRDIPNELTLLGVLLSEEEGPDNDFWETLVTATAFPRSMLGPHYPWDVR